jgi:hypothetical protein
MNGDDGQEWRGSPADDEQVRDPVIAYAVKHPRRLFKWLFLGIVLVALFFYVTRSREPAYQGRSLSEWAAELHTSGGPPGFIDYRLLAEDIGPKDACEAIRRIGPAAVPFLIKDLQARPSKLAVVFGSALRVFPSVSEQLMGPTSTMEEARWRAALALHLLGAAAKPALPVATSLLVTTNSYTYAGAAGAAVLAGLGDQGLRILRGALNTNNTWSNDCAVWGLAQMGDVAKPVVPELLRIAMARPRGAIVLEFWALDALGADSNAMIALAIADLKSTNAGPFPDYGKVRSLDWLAEHKEISLATAQVIIPFLSHPDSMIRQAASNALWVIDPTTAQTSGVSAQKEEWRVKSTWR